MPCTYSTYAFHAGAPFDTCSTLLLAASRRAISAPPSAISLLRRLASARALSARSSGEYVLPILALEEQVDGPPL